MVWGLSMDRFNWRDKGLSCILFKSVKYYYYVIIFVCFFVVVVVFFLQFEGGVMG